MKTDKRGIPRPWWLCSLIAIIFAYPAAKGASLLIKNFHLFWPPETSGGIDAVANQYAQSVSTWVMVVFAVAYLVIYNVARWAGRFP
jgi:hypothetical protein